MISCKYNYILCFNLLFTISSYCFLVTPYVRTPCIRTVSYKSRISYYLDQNQKGFNLFYLWDTEQTDKITLSPRCIAYNSFQSVCYNYQKRRKGNIDYGTVCQYYP